MRAPERQIRTWLESARVGALSTLSAAAGHDGWPFGSLTPYALDDEGRPIVLLAAIAEHTANLARDDRASLLVHEPGEPADVTAAWRITLLGRMRRLRAAGGTGGGVELPAEALAALRARYEERAAAAPAHRGLPGFDLFRLEVERVRFIAGFGQMGWAGPEALRP